MQYQGFLSEMDNVHHGLTQARCKLKTITDRLACSDRGKFISKYADKARVVFLRRLRERRIEK